MSLTTYTTTSITSTTKSTMLRPPFALSTSDKSGDSGSDDNIESPTRSLSYEYSKQKVENAATVVAMNKVLGRTPVPDDSLLIDSAMKVLISNPCSTYNPSIDPTLRIVSICSSSDTPYKYVIPQLLEFYSQEYHHKHDIQALISHVIPPHKTISMVSQRLEETDRSFSRQPQQEDEANSDYFSSKHHNSRANSSISVVNRSPYVSPEQMSHAFGNTEYTTSSSSAAASSGISPSSRDERLRFYRNNIYNNFALISRPERHSIPSVPPGSTHYAVTIHPIPTHVLPRFDVLAKTRYLELIKGGLMLICYPASRKLYDRNIIPCIDISLHQMLALNMISTSACEEVSVAPASDMIPSFEWQHNFLSSLDGAEILYSAQVDDFECMNWGHRWLNEEIDWLRQSLARAGYTSSQVLLKLIEGMTKNKEWKSTGMCDVSVFVVRKAI